MARTFQRLELFLSLSVRDNVRVAGDIVKASRRGSYDVEAETERVLELTGLGEIAEREVADIPTGRARVVEVARALMTHPRLLLLDEPASGQTEHETEVFAEMLQRPRRRRPGHLPGRARPVPGHVAVPDDPRPRPGPADRERDAGAGAGDA